MCFRYIIYHKIIPIGIVLYCFKVCVKIKWPVMISGDIVFKYTKYVFNIDWFHNCGVYSWCVTLIYGVDFNF